MGSAADTCVLRFLGLDISFHRTTRVPDHEYPSKQPITKVTDISHSSRCKLTPWRREGNDTVYLLALDCEPGVSLENLEAFGIRASMDRSVDKGVKLEIKVEGENIAAPQGLHAEIPSGDSTEQQPYFFLPNFSSNTKEEWVHGIAVNRAPRLVRQFVARNGGTGASLQHQATGKVNPDKMGIIQIEATIAPCPPKLPYAGLSSTQYSATLDACITQPSSYSGRDSILRRCSIAPRSGRARKSSPLSTSLETDEELEIVPGGLIKQPLPKDPGGIDWDSRPKTTFTIRVVNFEQFRSINNGKEPPKPPQLPSNTRMSSRGERNRGGTDSGYKSNAVVVEEHPPSPKETGNAPDTPPRGAEKLSTMLKELETGATRARGTVEAGAKKAFGKLEMGAMRLQRQMR